MPFMQIYLLTVLVNLLAGTALARTFLSEKIDFIKTFEEGLGNRTFQLVLGIVAVFAGIMALFQFHSGHIFFIGDLIPAITSLFAGALLIVPSFLSDEDQEERGLFSSLDNLAQKHGTVIGIGMMFVGLVHFFIPKAVLF